MLHRSEKLHECDDVIPSYLTIAVGVGPLSGDRNGGDSGIGILLREKRNQTNQILAAYFSVSRDVKSNNCVRLVSSTDAMGHLSIIRWVGC